MGGSFHIARPVLHRTQIAPRQRAPKGEAPAKGYLDLAAREAESLAFLRRLNGLSPFEQAGCFVEYLTGGVSC